MLIEKNTVFTNWLFSLCLKRKAMNNTLDNESIDNNDFNESIEKK